MRAALDSRNEGKPYLVAAFDGGKVTRKPAVSRLGFNSVCGVLCPIDCSTDRTGTYSRVLHEEEQ
jgi:hypothetical protein